MKTCIWCCKNESSVRFTRQAHTFPRSLEGQNICENVCDSCNLYFGSPQAKSPAVEVVLKEAFNISKFILLEHIKQNVNKRYKSEYFNFNWKNKTIQLKPRYKLERNFQERLGRLLRRGIYKIFLEERERQKGDALLERYNFESPLKRGFLS